ncbi:hypothetical protein SDC9_175941 [bioreactor metagenome]|uniref:Uncharacterized protein n=1 Tax=bioreactor metagenome TaxID=1076179 RepID=A0A645GRN5_9ZZZZ
MPGHAGRCRRPPALRRRARRAAGGTGAGDLRCCRRNGQPEFAEAARCAAVRETRHCARPQNQERVLHRRRCAEEAARRPSGDSAAARIPAVEQAQLDLCRRPAQSRPSRRQDSHVVQYDRHRHRAAFVGRSQSPEYSDPFRARRRIAPDADRRSRRGAGRRRLCSDRTPAAGAHRRRSGHDRRVSQSRRHSYRDRQPGLQRAV